MTNPNEIVLELVRPGENYGQLLSPLTDYVALCGDESPVTLRIDKKLEHWSVLNRLSRLRYMEIDPATNTLEKVPERQRADEIRTLGTDVGEIFAHIPTLCRELGPNRSEGLLHLRLVISGSELSIIPFELITGALGYPSAGDPLLLQKRLPIAITREVRQGRSLKVDWRRSPRILFISAAPAGLSVPLQEHVDALRVALEPWIKRANDPKDRVQYVKAYLTILADATLEQIAKVCSEEAFTHVHILAHGDAIETHGQRQFGLILCDKFDKNKRDVVHGRRLAAALRIAAADGIGESHPAVVTLAACDAGNPGSVVAPGGSIAHALHAAGIPWVFASQFPLTKQGSVTLAHELYKRLLRGDNPTKALHDVRNLLYVNEPKSHDWASLVCYAAPPENFETDCEWFFAEQMKEANNVDLEFAERRTTRSEDAEIALNEVRTRLTGWRERLSRNTLPQPLRDEMKSECLGLSGSAEKRMAEIWYKRGLSDAETLALRQALDYYKQANLIGRTGHWVAVQYLSLAAVLARRKDPDMLVSAQVWAQKELKDSDPEVAGWAHGTLAEVALLRCYHDPSRADAPERVAEIIHEHFSKIVELKGRESFHVQSTARQFRRYVDWWGSRIPECMKDAAEKVLAHLASDGTPPPSVSV